MAKIFRKIEPSVTLNDFLAKAKTVKEFISSTGKRYLVTKIKNDIMYFQRLDANEGEWNMDLMKVHKAYLELNDFATRKFKSYVPRTHSPARGLLIYLRMLD